MSSKRYKLLSVPNEIVSLGDAISVVKKNSTAKFDESVDFSISLNIQKKHVVRGMLVYPHSFGKSARVLVLCKGEKIEEAKLAGADFVGEEELISKIAEGWLGFDVVVSTPDMMKSIAKIARILGSRGMMPNPKSGTVSSDVSSVVKQVKSGRKEFRANEHGVLNFSVGKSSMSVESLMQNSFELYSAVIKLKPSDLKEDYVGSVFLSSTMGMSVQVDKKSISL